MTGELRLYDYESIEENLRVYGQRIPPLINFDGLKQAFANLDILLIGGSVDEIIPPLAFMKMR